MVMKDDPGGLYERYRAAVAGETLPSALVDLDALDRNVDLLVGLLRGTSKTLRVATKSLRCPELVARVRARAGEAARGLMTYTADETLFWAERGERDLLLAYPVAQAAEAAHIAAANAGGATTAVVVDCEDHLELLAVAAREKRTQVPVVVDVDVAWRPLGASVHIGVRRSPLRDAADVVRLAACAANTEGLRFHGAMAYEAQVASVPDAGPATRVMKRASMGDVVRRRAEVARALDQAGLRAAVFNGGGTGSLAQSASDPVLTEVTAGSGFLDSHLFDDFRGLDLTPAAFFALSVVRRPGERVVTCHGGGYVASGSAGKDRLPLPVLPEGLRLLALEGAGEVQTPLEVPAGLSMKLGDPVFFRHAKAGELAEHFRELLLLRGDEIEGRALTYRGMGKCFLG
jgi:D-serine deaminase-like pyridoxal phosphate-dependent protein